MREFIVWFNAMIDKLVRALENGGKLPKLFLILVAIFGVLIASLNLLISVLFMLEFYF